MLEKIKNFWLNIWEKDKGIVILIAALALFLKYRDILIGLLIGSAKRIETDAKKQDLKLEAQEDQLKKDADAQVKKASEEPQKEEPVDADWNIKK